MTYSFNSSGSPKTPRRRKSLGATDLVAWYLTALILALILVGSIRANYQAEELEEETVRGGRLLRRPCDEIYVVGEGETLNTISDKCGDPFIVERNPHIHDPDDVFPGLVIKIIPLIPGKF